MDKGKFEKEMKNVLQDEGGYVDNKKEKGGEKNMGIKIEKM